MAELRTRFILRNDVTSNWDANENTVLLKGELGIEFLTDGSTKVKIGDGVTSWKDLKYTGEDNVYNAETHYDFPSIGRENVVYKAQSEKKIYQWNPTELKYEVLSSAEASGDLADIEIIHGGNAAE